MLESREAQLLAARKSLAARQLAQRLAETALKIVYAESCTAGNVAGSLAIVPGISAWLCGSFVVYRNESKVGWLDIPRELLDEPAIGPVSPQVTLMLAQRALATTLEADLAAAVTGHIGPGSPPHLDGRVFFALTSRSQGQPVTATLRLHSAAPRDTSDIDARSRRLDEATAWALEQTKLALEQL